MYKRFDEDDDDILPVGLESTNLDLNSLDSPRHFTRSSVRPRMLWPDASRAASESQKARAIKAQHNLDIDLEADTDIEDPDVHKMVSTADQSSDEAAEQAAVTPVKLTFAPASPPSTVRATRASKKKAMRDDLSDDPSAQAQAPSTPTNAGTASLFTTWKLFESPDGTTATKKKREREPVESDEEGAEPEPAKKARK